MSAKPIALEAHSSSHLEAPGIRPLPPTDDEKYWYIQDKGRWVIGLSFGTTLIGTVLLSLFVMFHRQLLVLGVAAGVMFVAGCISFQASRKPSVWSKEKHEALVREWHHERIYYPSVDIFLPSAGEPLEVLAQTYYHVAKLRWAGVLRVYVLDDSARSEVDALASKYGFSYLSRPNRGEMKKAGNLKYGYSQTSGDFITVFDADFVPRHDFVNELVPHFEYDTGIVQSPQFFDSDSRLNWLERGAAITQEFFYRWVQSSRDSVGSPICVGTNAIYRRRALEDAGGFVQIEHSEDVHTGMALFRAGWPVKYVAINLAKGLCPDKTSSFINQQYRWCTGSMSLLRSKAFYKTHMSLSARLCFFSGFAYYITTAMLIFTAPLPLLAVLWFYPSHIHLGNYVAVSSLFVIGYLVQRKVYKCDWSPVVYRTQLVYSYAHALAIWDAIWGSSRTWVPTGSTTKSNISNRVTWLMRMWIGTVQLLWWGGLTKDIAAGWKWSFLAVALMGMWNAWVQLPSLRETKNSSPLGDLAGESVEKGLRKDTSLDITVAVTV